MYTTTRPSRRTAAGPSQLIPNVSRDTSVTDGEEEEPPQSGTCEQRKAENGHSAHSGEKEACWERGIRLMLGVHPQQCPETPCLVIPQMYIWKETWWKIKSMLA